MTEIVTIDADAVDGMFWPLLKKIETGATVVFERGGKEVARMVPIEPIVPREEPPTLSA